MGTSFFFIHNLPHFPQGLAKLFFSGPQLICLRQHYELPFKTLYNILFYFFEYHISISIPIMEDEICHTMFMKILQNALVVTCI